GAGSHELVIAQRTGAVYVDGFEVPCASEGDGADAGAVTSRSQTTTHAAKGSEGAVISRPIEVGPEVEHVSVLVEGALVPLTVRLLDPLGNLLATGGALLDGLAVSGVDGVPAAPGTYRLEVLNTAGALTNLQISTARTVASP
ncbi:MAG TPA: hypothetical protein VF100_01250, partial [Thermoanaerobaculia bacterium]